MSGLELLTIGRISVDLYAEQLGVPLAEVQTWTADQLKVDRYWKLAEGEKEPRDVKK